MTFNEIRIGFNHLPEFSLTEHLLVRDQHTLNREQGLDEIQATYAVRGLPKAIVDGVSFEFDQQVQLSGNRIRRYTIEPKIELKLRSEYPLTTGEWLNRFVIPLQHLLTLATTHVNHLTSLKAFHDENVELEVFASGEHIDSLVPFDVIIQGMIKWNKTEYPVINSLLFDLGNIEGHYEKVLQRWFSLYDKHRPVQNLLFGVLFAPDAYPEDRFLNLARALEIYHRNKYPGGEMPKADFKRLRNEIVAQVEDQHKGWLQKKLIWANELTLQDRIARLIRDCDKLQLPEALDISVEDLARIIKDQRNRLTHYSSEKKVVSSSTLVWLSHLIEFLLKALLLKELGFSTIRIKRDPQYDFRVQKIREMLEESSLR